MYKERPMANYITTSFSSATDTNACYGTTSWIIDDIQMYKERPMAKYPAKAKTTKKKKEVFQCKSALMSAITKNIGLIPYGFYTLFHSPMINKQRDPLYKDISTLDNVGYSVNKHSIAFYDDLKEITGPLNMAIVVGVFEHLVNDMAKALLIKSIMSKLNHKEPSRVILVTKSRKQIQQKAKINNYPKDGDNYLVSLPDGRQGRLKGIDQDELYAIAAYGRFKSSILRTNILSDIKDPHIILSDGF